MPSLQLYSFSDLVEHALDYAGGNVSDAASERFARRAVQDALNTICNEKNWHYFYQQGRINTVATYATGTLSYDTTGGAVERLLTLASGTFPSWAGEGTVLIGNVTYDIFARLSDTTAQMATYSNPGADIASSSYMLFKDTYTLPIGFGAMGQLVNATSPCRLYRITADDMTETNMVLPSPGTPYRYTTTSDPRKFGVLALKFYPAPDQVYALNYSYRRSPRQLNIARYDTGTASCVTDSTTLTGSGTVWTSKMIGAVVRLSADNENVPTGVTGANPNSLERIVADVVSTTQITLDSAADVTLSAVKHAISDPIDIETGAMLNYLLRSVERSMRIIRRMKKADIDEEREWQEARVSAYEADSRNYERRSPSDRDWFLTPGLDRAVGAEVG